MIARRMGVALGLVGVALTMVSCKVDQKAFDARIFPCDPSSKDPGCGTDSNGDPMVCYPASLLDGTDFCTDACGDTPMSLGDGTTCVEGRAELKACDPSVPESCGQSSLGCLRTDVTSEEGVCTTMTPCTVDSDCTDPVRTTCAATFLKSIYSKNTTLEADNLYCLQKNCQSGQSSCSPGQSCLPLLVPPSANAPDICVPNCDAQGNCPPNHTCFQKISGPANPAICIPGLLGFICATDINCLVGKCMSDGDPDADNGLKLCTIPCNSDADCSTFDSDQGLFSCIGGHCETPNAYRGNSCFTDADCTRDENTFCYFQTPPAKPTDLGTCLRPCTADATVGTLNCAPRAGISHTCLPFVDSTGATSPGCYPGFFPYPCLTTANCVGDLTCRGADLTTSPPTEGNCTTLCQNDDDCNADRWTAGQSFCAPQGICAPLLEGGKPCTANTQCQSKDCQLGDASAVGTCASPTP